MREKRQEVGMERVKTIRDFRDVNYDDDSSRLAQLQGKDDLRDQGCGAYTQG